MNPKNLISVALIVLAGCAGDPSIGRRPVDIVNVIADPAPHRVVTLAADIEFSIPINSPIYRQIDVRLPGGRYELRYHDDDGYYFLAIDGKLRITGDGGSKSGGIFVPKNTAATWRVWEVPNFGAAIAIFGPGAAAFGTGKGKAIRHDLIPASVSHELDALFRAATEPNTT